MSKFKILQRDGQARVGRLTTPHGIIELEDFINSSGGFHKKGRGELTHLNHDPSLNTPV